MRIFTKKRIIVGSAIALCAKGQVSGLANQELCFKHICKGDYTNVNCVAACYGINNVSQERIVISNRCYFGCQSSRLREEEVNSCILSCNAVNFDQNNYHKHVLSAKNTVVTQMPQPDGGLPTLIANPKDSYITPPSSPQPEYRPGYNGNEPGYNPNGPGYNGNEPGYNPNAPDYNPNGPDYNRKFFLMEQLRQISSKVEQFAESNSRHYKAYLPIVARTLLVSTFIEDSIRIILQWSSQLNFLRYYRGFPIFLNHLFLIYNVVVMLASSWLAITRKHTELAVAGLLTIVIGQGFAYGLIFEFSFFMRNLSVIGGLLILMAESYIIRKKAIFAGIPSISEADRSRYVLLARYSAMVLTAILSVFNLIANNWWSIDFNNSERDFVKYDFFQVLSIVGGFLLLVNIGPGSFSVDEKKKDY
ncbi:hypothetical protein BB561_005919 [Smittium simulii]|uniref:Uncharacterized protein n=1 Tax=Smittium simulii TaxID=133385 RepID=A0A2T9Y7N8_9FUNG|nr:hypothetical protein BB561_005919 [Smittium simulii]